MKVYPIPPLLPFYLTSLPRGLTLNSLVCQTFVYYLHICKKICLYTDTPPFTMGLHHNETPS
jgi:hypothetical protein